MNSSNGKLNIFGAQVPGSDCRHGSLAIYRTHGQFGQPGFDIDKYHHLITGIPGLFK